VSRWELLQQIASGLPNEAVLFAQANERGMKAALKKVGSGWLGETQVEA
jgi:hypothetical protein